MWCLALLALVNLGGCDETPTLDPPEVRWGQSVCSECGMILSDQRYAAATVSIDNGERQERLFDDVGELFKRPRLGATASRRWVTDAATQTWIDAETATYLRSAALHTPMGNGLAAYADAANAQAKQAELGGELLTATDLDTDPQ